ncbi:glycosyltransferase [Blautia obeum]|uniref:glycosyltransferase n=1 Tax=Blautia obeum TaxID=40520 RepID=UPI0034A3DE08
MSNEIVLSIIIPVYNTAEYIVECLDSIGDNYRDFFEIILVNDGSTDNSLSVIDNYLKKDNYNIKLINQTNKGLSAARNIGICKSIGKYLMFLDSDDSLKQNTMTVIIEAIQKKENEFCDVFRIDTVSNNKNGCQKIYNDRNEFIFEFLCNKKKNWPAVLYICRRNFVLLNKLKFKEGYLHEDVIWTSELLLSAEKVIDLGIECYQQREIRNGSITSTPNPKRLNDIIILVTLAQKQVVDSTLNYEVKRNILGRLTQAVTSLTWLYYYMSSNELNVFQSRENMYKKILTYSNTRKTFLFYRLVEYIGVKKSLTILKPWLMKSKI